MEHDEKVRMYNKLSKRELIELLINSDSVIGSLDLRAYLRSVHHHRVADSTPVHRNKCKRIFRQWRNKILRHDKSRRIYKSGREGI